MFTEKTEAIVYAMCRMLNSRAYKMAGALHMCLRLSISL